MTVYLDTSAAIPLFVAEPASDSVDRWFSACDDIMVSADWILTEFASALSIKQRSGTLSARHAAAAWHGFATFCQSGLRLAPVSRQAFEKAAHLARQPAHGLRASDALHLAVAQETGADTLATLDATMAGNAKRLRMKTVVFA